MKKESQPKFTPGPWRFNDAEMKVMASIDEVTWPTVIADVSPKMRYSKGMGTQCYNAALIAQAPAMYALLAKFEDRFRKQVEVYLSECRISDNEAEEALLILASARGESNPEQL